MPETRIIDNANSVSKFRDAAESSLYRKVGEKIALVKSNVAQQMVVRKESLDEAKSSETKRIDALVALMDKAVKNNDKKAYKKAEKELTSLGTKLRKENKT